MTSGSFKGKLTSAAAWARRRGGLVVAATQELASDALKRHAANKRHRTFSTLRESKLAPHRHRHHRYMHAHRMNQEKLRHKIKDARFEVQEEIRARFAIRESAHHARMARRSNLNPLNWIRKPLAKAKHAVEKGIHKIHLAVAPGVYDRKELYRSQMRHAEHAQSMREARHKVLEDGHNHAVAMSKRHRNASRPGYRHMLSKAWHKTVS